MCVVGGSGIIKSTTHHLHGIHVSSITVDQSTGMIFIMYYVDNDCSVDVMSPNGEVIAEKILTTTAARIGYLSCYIPHT